MFRKEKPRNSQNRPHNGNPRYRLLQHQHGSHHRYDGNHVNINAGLNRAKHLYREVPCDEAECGSPQTKIQDIEQMRHICKPFQPDFKIEKEQCRNHEQDAVKERPPCGQFPFIVCVLLVFFLLPDSPICRKPGKPALCVLLEIYNG